ncbi:hypothetical protein V1503_23685 [Bacillus sp. SCS-151]|uniref:hypothetical protein n=1 Tax=Nanhaiella sioensis TaxID=3115293 RepID=UPI00397ACBC7
MITIKKFIYFFIGYIAIMVIGIVVYQIYFTKTEVDFNAGKQLIQELDNNIKKSMNQGEEGNESGYGYNPELISTFQSIENNMNFLAVTLVEENVTYFTSLFLPEKVSEALFT